MTDKEKLDTIKLYLKSTRAALDVCMDEDTEYNTTLGNGTNASEASSMFEEVEEQINKIIGENMKIIKKVNMENTEDNHSKQWTGILFDNDDVLVSWGPIGGNESSKPHEKVGAEFLDKKAKEKEKKGYVIV